MPAERARDFCVLESWKSFQTKAHKWAANLQFGFFLVVTGTIPSSQGIIPVSVWMSGQQVAGLCHGSWDHS
jgi:hypothetical protein